MRAMSSAFSAVTLRRRDFLQLAAGAAALGTASTVASAQAYPTRPVHWIVSFTAGGPNDTDNTSRTAWASNSSSRTKSALAETSGWRRC
jgi:tripartite-type tricarboxylate transporter receptor subunit TctC